MSTIAVMSEKGYFQFPLCLLAFREDYKERLQHIVSYCLCEQARRTNRRFPKSARIASLNHAATFLDVTIGWQHDNIISEWKEANGFVCQWEGRYGKDPFV